MKVIATITAATLPAFTTAGLATAVPTTPKVDKPRLPAAARNVRLKASLPQTNGAISIAFAQYGKRDVAFVSATDGLKTFDVTDLASPKLLDQPHQAGDGAAGRRPGADLPGPPDRQLHRVRCGPGRPGAHPSR